MFILSEYDGNMAIHCLEAKTWQEVVSEASCHFTLTLCVDDAADMIEDLKRALERGVKGATLEFSIGGHVCAIKKIA